VAGGGMIDWCVVSQLIVHNISVRIPTLTNI
jgi:hypothetical protein